MTVQDGARDNPVKGAAAETRLPRRLFLAAARGHLAIEHLAPGEVEPREITKERLPLVVVPAGWSEADDGTSTVIVAIEGADRRMAAQVRSLLDPTTATLALVHVTWVPGTVASPLPADGLDNPQPIDLLLYRGATEALVDAAEELRAAGFTVTTHLREARHPAEAIDAVVSRMSPVLLVLGLGRHGAGIGRDILRRARVPILYVDAR